MMTEVSADQLKKTVESHHGGTAKFVQWVPTHEEYNGQVVWDGTVAVFDLKRSPTGAFRVYAWSNELPDGKRRIVTVLHTPVIVGPRHAVMAAIVAETRAKNPVEARQLLLSQWRALPSDQRTKKGASVAALGFAEDFPFEAANRYGLIWGWLMEDLE